MIPVPNKKTFGLALSGSGNRTPFYIGFFEVLDEAGIKTDYISACSGGSLVSAAYACGGLEDLKKILLNWDESKIKNFINPSGIKNGGLYSLDPVEELLHRITGGKNFEEVNPKMTFMAVDIESGELVDLCMGDIARAATISCILPGLFEPVKWGEKTLVDGGLLVMVPARPVKRAGIDVCVGINMRGTKHIFTERQISFKKVFNFIKKVFLVEYFGNFFGWIDLNSEHDVSKNPNLFTVLGKSIDLAIKASQNEVDPQSECDLLIVPEMRKLQRTKFNREAVMEYYELGRKTAKEYLPKIKELLEIKV